MAVSAKQAFEAREIGEPYMVSARHAEYLVVIHNQNIDEFFAHRDNRMMIDLADVFKWLGYPEHT